MPGRNIPLVNEEVYHVFNRGIAGQPIYKDKRDYQRFLDLIKYYQNIHPFPRYSKFLTLSNETRTKTFQKLRTQSHFLVAILGFCLMPNHFHILLKQKYEGGTSLFLSNLTNSYTRYFNTKTKRVGPLLQGKFKAVHIEDDEQLLHVIRYIHLNPYTSSIIKTLAELKTYPYSSLKDYIIQNNFQIIETDQILGNFKNSKSFISFTLDQAKYQKQLGLIKHLILE